MNVLEVVLGVVVAAVAVTLVAWPLWHPPVAGAAVLDDAPTLEETRKGVALLALREIDFDRETGKLSDQDYERLKAAYTAEAVAALRAEEGRSARASDSVEALIAARVRVLGTRASSGSDAGGHASCATCGPRPESDAIYCSECGTLLAGHGCTRCGALLPVGARFCEACGSPVAGAA
ncbi:MAG TPA: zinc ribbon domain-containing protein [Gemmatimonadales bacterium]|nr:zinc ribbon domain-containing protein [Gemmatimonadales bacterium]